MIITGQEIIKQREKGNILIDPFDESKVNPNSYNLSLHNVLKRYEGSGRDMFFLDMKRHNPTYEEIIHDGVGLKLEPGVLYLGKTVEYTETYNLVPMVEGRSSLGRLGIFVQVLETWVIVVNGL